MLNPDRYQPVVPSDIGHPVPFEGVQLVLFDLDGTLVDSVGDLAWCGNEMLRLLGMPARDSRAASIWVGNGVERFVKRVLTNDMNAEPEADLFRAGLEIFNSLYAENISAHSEVYPGVRECLEELSRRDFHLACVTNKAERFTTKLLKLLDLSRFFELVVSGDTTARKKPDPLPLRYAADYFSLEYRNCMMVGDSSNDVTAARAAGFKVVCVPYGYNHGQPVEASCPDRVIENLVELNDLLGEIA